MTENKKLFLEVIKEVLDIIDKYKLNGIDRAFVFRELVRAQEVQDEQIEKMALRSVIMEHSEEEKKKKDL